MNDALALLIVAWLLSMLDSWAAILVLVGFVWLATRTPPAQPTQQPTTQQPTEDDDAIPLEEPFNDGRGWFAPATPHDWETDRFAHHDGNEQFFD